MNGTTVNSQSIVDPAQLGDGDKIQIGDTVFKFAVQDAIDVQFHREIHRLIHYDELTGLMTMGSFRRVLEHAIAAARENQVFTVAMTDLDGLKRVNDTYGHLAGRMVIAEMGAMMRDWLRAKDFAGLYGGDEAIVLFPSTPAPEAQALADSLRTRIESRSFELGGNRFSVTLSQGLAEWPLHGQTVEAIIAAADCALYEAKKAGRNCVHVHGSSALDHQKGEQQA
jgi:diguanylate cyclase (GGDEF)-like protein